MPIYSVRCICLEWFYVACLLFNCVKCIIMLESVDSVCMLTQEFRVAVGILPRYIFLYASECPHHRLFLRFNNLCLFPSAIVLFSNLKLDYL